MANYNLTSQQIKDTYEQLVQISSSTLVNGLGNTFDVLVPSSSHSLYAVNALSASYALTASFAANATIPTLQQVTDEGASTDNDITLTNPNGNQTITISGPVGSLGDVILRGNTDYGTTFENGGLFGASEVEAFSYTMLSGTNSKHTFAFQNGNRVDLRGSGSIGLNLIGGGNDTATSRILLSPANSSRIALYDNSAWFTIPITGSIISASGGFVGDLTGTASYATNANTLDGLDSSDFAQLAINNIFSGTQTFNNIAVNGTASIAHVQQVTGSAVIIGEEFIILNAATPAARYAGIKIYDTGSTSATASIEWDGVQDTWMLMEETGNTSVIITGPTGSRGSETFTTKNRLQKGLGYNYIGDSNISDDGSQVSITGPVSASTYYGDGSNLTGIEGGLVLGSTPTSLQSALTTTPATAVGTSSLAIGDGADATGDFGIAIGTNTDGGTEGIAIGYNVDSADYATAIGYNITNTGGGGNIAIGRNVTIGSDYTIAIGENSNANAPLSVTIGYQSSTNGSTNSTAIGANAVAQNGYATAIGESARATNDASIAIGAQVEAASNQAIAIGTEADVLGSSVGAIAIGQGAQVTGTQAIGIGQGVSTSAANEVNIGNRLKFDGSSVITLSGSIVSASANFEVAGQLYSPTFAGSVASSTSSVDFNNGNFATLNLTVPTFIANPSNLKSGTTYTIIIDSGSLVSNYGSAFKFAGGTQPTLSEGIDILTMVSDGTSLYATALADFQ